LESPIERTCFEQEFNKNLSTLVRRIAKVIFDRRAVSNAVSVTILTGAVIALSLAVFSWSQSRSSEYSSEFSETVDAETARLKEKLVFEYISYCNPSHNITAYLFNCGTVDDVEIKSVYVRKGGSLIAFSSLTLYSLEGTPIPDQDLDAGEEGRVVLELSSTLSSGYYNIIVVTTRGAKFGSSFVA
jgi:hypothetical protein